MSTFQNGHSERSFRLTKRERSRTQYTPSSFKRQIHLHWSLRRSIWGLALTRVARFGAACLSRYQQANRHGSLPSGFVPRGMVTREEQAQQELDLKKKIADVKKEIADIEKEIADVKSQTPIDRDMLLALNKRLPPLEERLNLFLAASGGGRQPEWRFTDQQVEQLKVAVLSSGAGGPSSPTYVMLLNSKRQRLTEGTNWPGNEEPSPQHRDAAPVIDNRPVPDFLKEALKAKDGRALKSENEDLLPLAITALKFAATGSASAATPTLPLGIVNKGYVAVGGVRVVDTHTLKYLAGTAPDLTAVREEHGVTPFTALFIIELQLGPLDNTHKGKTLYNVEQLLLANPARPFAEGMLTNLVEVIFISAKRVSDGIKYFESHPYQINSLGGWHRFVAFCTRTPEACGYKVPSFDSVPGLTGVTGYLGSSRNVRVWEAETGDGKVAVKQYLPGSAATPVRKESYERECEALHAVAGKSTFFPELIWEDPEQGLIVTKPVVKPAGYMTHSRLQKVFKNLKLLHGMGLVYRDLEVKHLGIPVGSPDDGDGDGDDIVLIDWSTAISYGQESLGGGYAGTLGYASKDVLDWMRSQTGTALPGRWQQDLVPLVKTVYVMVHPAAHQACQKLLRGLEELGGSLRHHADAVGEFWDTEFSSSTGAGQEWRRLVNLAHMDDLAHKALHEQALAEMIAIDAAHSVGGEDANVAMEVDPPTPGAAYELVTSLLERALARHLRASH